MSWHDEKERPIYAEIDRVTAQKVAAMSEPNREAVEAAVAAHNAARLDAHGSRAAMFAALTAALPHLLAAKNAEIAALKIELGRIANKRAWHELTTNQCMDSYWEMRLIARAALEMSGGVK